ncbi:kinectin isoform X9 [Nasonia vitripennis]|uniref:Kinectin n=1 Tax=Nasonia vitripennis TaxID=7425 RepID=A0A7M7QXC4_NASVI|nr:kinectin isoform X9 [Nasonia vitripennis]XP_032455133.1 kinectin isoform X9 [Nasonia vitripennis]XP_032455134.1 kinectin isoform X9 [Nasonia vitripennis]
MDVQTGLVYVAVVLVSALVIGFVSVFAMKEKSYEEAIAEQRKLPDDLLLGKKEKIKEKKHKNKTGKKVKEKKEEKEEKEEKPEHVQFEETPQILPPEPPVQRENLSQIGQSEPPGLVNKSPKETPTRSKKNAKEKDSKKKDDHKEEKKEVPTTSNQPSASAKDQVKEKPKETIKEVKEPKEPVKENVTPLQSSNKESKKIRKKNDILAQIGGDRDGVNFSLLKPLVQKAELSRSEIQILIDQLLNKQQDNPLEHAEWTESRADPVIKLKKQLADKEKALKDEQEASVSVQSKLLELRAELNGERSRFTANVRQLEEALNAKVSEAQTLHTRMQHILESHAAEKLGFTRKIETLESKEKEDAAIILKLKEDQGNSQGHLQQELHNQRKQMDIQFAQMRDSENALKAQLAQKHAELQELQNVNITISQELQATCDSSTHEIEMLRQQLSMMQEQVMHSDAQIQIYKETSDRLQDAHRQLEESRRVQSEMDHRIKSMHRHEQELQKQITWFQTELDAAKAESSETNAALEKARADLAKAHADDSVTVTDNGNSSETSEIAAKLKAKEIELQKTLSEASKAQAELKKTQGDIKKLESDLMEARNELKVTKSELGRAQDNYKLAQNDLIKCQEELREIQHVLAQTRAEFSKINSFTSSAKDNKHGEAELKIVRLQEENDRLSAQLGGMGELQKEIKQLREKNESLSSQLAASTERPAVEGRENGIEEKAQKNSIQTVENTNLLAQKEDQLAALRTALSQKEKELDQLGTQVESLRSEVNDQRSVTSRLQDDLEQQRSKNNDDVQKLKEIKVEEQEATKALLQRIFPEIKVSEKSHDQWMKAFEEQVYTALDKLKTDTYSESASAELEKTNKNLQAMVNHYKQIIYDTEGMLNKLQSHIESEEKRWQAQLRQKENEVSNLRVEIHDLQDKTISDNNELQQKIADLESRVSEAESLKAKTKTESAHTQNRVPDLAVLEQLQEEKARLTQQLQNESSKRATLDAEVAKLLLLVETTESNLSQEKKLVSQLQQEVSQLKSEVCGGSSSSDQMTLNGPPVTDSPQSEPTVGAQCLIAALEKTLLKNTELENCSLAEPENSVESQQDIDDGSLTSKFASNTCRTTENVIQNSCNPLNGPQHKKHKKKRKGGSGKK